MFILRALLCFVLGTFAMAIPISQTNDTIAMPNIYQRGFGSPSHASSSSSSPPSPSPSKFDASGYWVPFGFTYEVVEDVIYIIRDPEKDDRWYAYPLNPTGTNLKKSAKEMAQERPGKQWEMILDNQEFVDQHMWKKVVFPVLFQKYSYHRLSIDATTGKISLTNPVVEWTQAVVFDDKEKLPELLEQLKKKKGSAPTSH